MPTKRTRISRTYVDPTIPQWQLNYLRTGAVDRSYDCWKMREGDWREIYNAARTELLREWIQEKPCSRPFSWWLFESPNEERKQIAGKGTRADSKLAYCQHFKWGVPSVWIAGTVDADNPPVFESEASYLKRLRQATPTEEKVIGKYLKKSGPVSIFEIFDPTFVIGG